MDLLAFLRANWRWLLTVLAIIFAVLLLPQGSDYAQALWQRHELRTELRRTTQTHDARLTADARAQHRADSISHRLTARRLELARQAYLLQQADESLSSSLPAAPELPAAPPRR